MGQSQQEEPSTAGSTSQDPPLSEHSAGRREGDMAAHSLLTGERLKKELEAQKARAAARAYVEAQGCDIRTSVDALRESGRLSSGNTTVNQELSQVEGAAKAGRDNTLEVLHRRKIVDDAKVKEQELKARLLKQQEDFREERETKAAAPPGGALPTGWQEVADPSGTGDVYYWNKVTGETTWTRPTEPAKPPEGAQPPATAGQQAAAGPAAGTSSSSSSSLPPGWKEVKHAATGQVYYYHEETKTKRWTRPTSEEDMTSDIAQKQKEYAASVKAAKQASSSSVGMKRPRAEAVDPLDPTGGKGKWSDGMLNKGERMADSTASGSLWQQRPLPAPGQILKGKARR